MTERSRLISNVEQLLRAFLSSKNKKGGLLDKKYSDYARACADLNIPEKSFLRVEVDGMETKEEAHLFFCALLLALDRGSLSRELQHIAQQNSDRLGTSIRSETDQRRYVEIALQDSSQLQWIFDHRLQELHGYAVQAGVSVNDLRELYIGAAAHLSYRMAIGDLI